MNPYRIAYHREPRFTPGPWHVEFFGSAPDKPFVCASHGQEDPVINEFSEIGGAEVAWANAELAAAAPDLLEALTECVNPLINALFAYLANRNEPEDVALFGLLDNTNMEVQAVIAKALGDAG